MALGNRVKLARVAREMTQEELGHLVGVSQTAIYNLEKRDSKSSRNSDKIAAALRVRLEWLINGQGPMTDSVFEDALLNSLAEHKGASEQKSHSLSVPATNLSHSAMRNTHSLPLLKLTEVLEWLDSSMEKKKKFTESCEVTGTFGPNSFCVILKDDSMLNPAGSPSIPPDYTLCVDPDAEIASMRIVLAIPSESARPVCRQLIDNGSGYLLKPLNPRYPVIEMDSSGRIIGTVVKVEYNLDHSF